MTQEEFTQLLEELRARERELRSAQTQEFYKTQPPDVVALFVRERSELSEKIEKLEVAQLNDILEKLTVLEDDLKSGVKALRRKLQQLESAIGIINSVTKIVGLVARVLAL